MARFSLSLKAKTTWTPPGNSSAPVYVFANAGGATDIGTQASAVATDVATISTDAATLHTQYGSIQASLTTLISTIGSGTGSAAAQALLALVNTGSTDLATLVADVATGTTAANAMSTTSSADLVVSVNATNITTQTQLKRAFDKCIDLAQGGVGGLTK